MSTPPTQPASPRPDSETHHTVQLPPSDVQSSWNTSSTSFGPYEIRGEISRGGMGIVWRAYHPEMKREVALKVMRTGRNADREELIRFSREAKAMASLQHPGIVRVLDSGVVDDEPYYAMELINGEPLDHLIRGRVLTRAEIIRLGIEICEALQHAHDKGILHRDLKPGNVLIDENNRAKLFDFGLAKLLDSQSTQLTQSGWIVGTPNYMSPEQARGQSVTTASDIFSMGSLFFEMLCGELAFPGNDGSLVLRSIIEHHPAPPSTHDPTLDPALDAICIKALQKLPDERYLSAKVMALDIRNHDQKRRIIAHGPRPLARGLKHLSRHRKIWALTLAGVLSVLAFVSWRVRVLTRYEQRIVELEDALDELTLDQAATVNQLRLRQARVDYFHGLHLAGKGRREEALILFREAWRQDPDSSEARIEVARMLHLLGREAADRGALPQAEKYLRETARLNPSRLETLLLLVDVLGAQGKIASARSHAQQYIRQRPRDIRAYLLIGKIELEGGRLLRAHKMARLALSLNIKSFQAWGLMGRVMLGSRKLTQAIKALDRSIRLRPSWQAHHHRAVALLSQGKLEQAIKDASTALTLEPANIHSLLLRGRVHLQRNARQAARRDLSQVLQGKTKRKLETMICHAHALYYLDRTEEALEALRRWHQQQPRNPESLRMIAHLLQRNKRYAEAREAWAEVLRRVPDDKRARDALAQLRGK